MARKFATWAATAVLSFGVLFMSGIPYNLGSGWILAILDPTPGFTGYSPSGFLGMQVNRIGDALGLPGGDIAKVLRTALKYLGIGIVVLLMFWGEGQRSHRVVRRMGLAFAAVVMLSPSSSPGTSCGSCRSWPSQASRTTGRCVCCTWLPGSS